MGKLQCLFPECVQLSVLLIHIATQTLHKIHKIRPECLNGGTVFCLKTGDALRQSRGLFLQNRVLLGQLLRNGLALSDLIPKLLLLFLRTIRLGADNLLQPLGQLLVLCLEFPQCFRLRRNLLLHIFNQPLLVFQNGVLHPLLSR